MPLYVFFLCVALIAGAFFWRKRVQERRKAALLAETLYPDERAYLERGVPVFSQLPPELKHKLEGKMNLFLHQVEFVGCNGLEVTEEMQLSIAAQACLLVLGRNIWYDDLRQILIYPGSFRSLQENRVGYVVTEQTVERLGESWTHGPVILSWQHSASGMADPADGHNVVFHEFAHKLDDLTGHTNAIPLLAEGQSFEEWEDAMLSSYERHARAVERGRKTLLDPYGAQSHVEFFAVAVEVFFEQPKPLRDEEPALYAQLSKLFQLDPANWT